MDTSQHPLISKAFELYKQLHNKPHSHDQFSQDCENEWILCQIREDLGSEPQKSKFDKYLKCVVQKKRLGFNHVQFDQLLQKQKEQDDYVLNPFQAEEGVVECKKCGSSKVYSLSVQTRAADEPMTTVSVCTICKHKWSQNG